MVVLDEGDFNSEKSLLETPVIIDECCSKTLRKFFEKKIFDLTEIHNGMSDDMIVDMAERKGAYIITRDKGFDRYPYGRIIVLRYREPGPENVYEMFLAKMRETNDLD